MLIIGNWKMNGSIAQIHDFFNAFQAQNDPSVEVVIAPPYAHLGILKNHNETVQYAAQDCSIYPNSGAYTGEVSAQILKDVGCTYVIVGHSERRQYFLESDQSVLTKTQNVLAAGLIPVVCVGESLAERQANQTNNVLEKQLSLIAQHIDHAQSIVIAYEPIWAIGTGLVPENKEIQAGCSFIQTSLKNFNQLRVLYGGSVNAENAPDIFQNSAVQGALVGGASLKPQDFKRIIDCAKTNTNLCANTIS